MSYKYKMQNILDLKSDIEEQKKEEFGSAMFLLNHEEEILSAINKEKISAIERKELEKMHFNINRLKQYTLYLKMIDQRIEEQEIRVEEQRKMVLEKKEEMLEARKETKAFEKLKEHDYEEFMEEEKKTEEKTIDSIVTFNTMKKLES